jgi:serine/threonine-protein kinase RsbW
MASRRNRKPQETEPVEIRELTVLGRYGYNTIPIITQFVAEAAHAAFLDEDSVFHCQMAVDEACTNIIEHAYGEEDTGNIEIVCLVEPARCTIRIVDHGKPFDPMLVPEPKATTNLEDIRPGGIGLHLMKQLMDEVRFEFTEQGNTLTMVKTSPKPAVVPSSSLIKVRQDKRGITIFRPKGQVDSMAAGELDTTMSEVIGKGNFQVIVDMADVTYISSRGLKALVSGWRKCQDRGGQFAICSVAPRVQSIIDTIGFNQIFDIYPTLEDALVALSTVTKSKSAS